MARYLFLIKDKKNNIEEKVKELTLPSSPSYESNLALPSGATFLQDPLLAVGV